MSSFNFDIFMKFFEGLQYLTTKYYMEKKEFFDKVLLNAIQNSTFCKNTKITELTIQSIIIFLLFAIFWLIYDSLHQSYYYVKSKSYLYFKENSKLIDDPVFIQINNLYYLNNYFAIDINFFWFLFTAFFIILKIYYLELFSDGEEVFDLLKTLCYLILIIGVIFYIINYSNIISLGKRVNVLNKLIYNNINIEFINSQKICNYLNKKSEYDYEFTYGKCNDIAYNYSASKLYAYINLNINEIQELVGPINNLSIEKFKKLKDKNGVLYKDKIKSAIFTYQIISYYLDNDLIEEAKDFFSTYNLIYSGYTDAILKTRINPILFLRSNNIMLFDKSIQYTTLMSDSFGDYKNIYNLIYKEYSDIQNNIQNIIIDVYNICNYKMISVYIYYFIIFILIVLFVFYYILKNLKY
jgi:hypothetical protein